MSREHQEIGQPKTRGAFLLVLVQILLLDIVFSLDSVITAVGMANQLPVMVTAMVLAMLVMLASAGSISGFVDRHPSVKILALSFLLLIGVMLVAEGMGTHMEKGYVYFAMAFSLFVSLSSFAVLPFRAAGERCDRRRQFGRFDRLDGVLLIAG